MDSPTDPTGSTPLPSGTVTFLFSDIEGSTLRWERHRASMEAAVERHDRVLRTTITENGGAVFKTVGDAFCAAFSRAQDAIAAALAAQNALAAEDFGAVGGLGVRMAAHTGTAHERDGDYFGPDVNRVARILAVGHGGQVLLSGVTADLALAALPERATLRDLGQQRLKDLQRPEQVYQLIAPGLRDTFPPLKSLDRLPNNLPHQLSSFIGREREIDEITDLLRTHRLVSLVGAGGVGKSRISLQVAANLLDGSEAGVWFVELAPLNDAAIIPQVVAAALGHALEGGDPLRALAAAVGPEKRLIVLDNCEHLVTEAARVAQALLRRCPGLVLLASSRQPLGVEGEAVYRMPTLDEATAVRLFEERAQLAERRFALNPENEPVISDICRLLDRIPLAIELAAARVTVIGPEQLRRRLDQRFRLLQGGSRTALPRQQTLRALIDWSYDLLEPRERLLFDRLGIFVGSFTLEAAADVCSDDTIDDLDIFDVLALLVDRSLVVAEVDGSATRYHLLESMRAYASERIDAAGERARLERKHLDHYAGCVAQAYASYDVSARDAAYVPVYANIDNVRIALERALSESGDIICGVRLVGQMRWFDWREGLDWFRAFAARPLIGDPCARAHFWMNAYPYFANFGEPDAAEAAIRHAQDAAGACSDPTILPLLLGVRAQWLARHDVPAAERDLRAFEAALRPSSSLRMRERFRFVRGFIALSSGNLDVAAADFAYLFEAESGRENFARIDTLLMNLAEAEIGRGDYERALDAQRKNLAQSERRRQFDTMFTIYGSIAIANALLGRFDDAFSAGRAAAALPIQPSSDYRTASIVEALALGHAARGDFERAAILVGFGQAAWDDMGVRRETSEMNVFEKLDPLLDHGLDSAERARLSARGAALSRVEALTLALADTA